MNNMFKLAVIIGDIRSVHNVGSILRTADGFGVNHIYYAGFTPYPLQPNDTRLPHESRKITAQIHKTALGAETITSSLHANILDAITAAKEDGYSIAALEQSIESQNITHFIPQGDTALLLGNEITGISHSVLESADVILEIPMFGTKESFNVSVAAGIALYHLHTAGNP
jgi:tRNA G18 (ribose-2'-O)-methylase SpoU